MNDKELLELAAKAAEIQGEWDPFRLQFRLYADVQQMFLGDATWNPLTDDGDALRLAVALGVSVVITKELGITDARVPDKTAWMTEQHWDSTGAATRRAIVRAAAEIGKAMP